MEKILYKDLCFKINGLLFKIHNELGRFRNEKQYADYFEKLLESTNLKYEREYRFEDNRYGKDRIRCICDFVIENNIILEFKAKDFINKEDYYQLQRYLATLNLKLGIIVNFRNSRITPKRILNSKYFR